MLEVVTAREPEPSAGPTPWAKVDPQACQDAFGRFQGGSTQAKKFEFEVDDAKDIMQTQEDHDSAQEVHDSAQEKKASS